MLLNYIFCILIYWIIYLFFLNLIGQILSNSYFLQLTNFVIICCLSMFGGIGVWWRAVGSVRACEKMSRRRRREFSGKATNSRNLRDNCCVPLCRLGWIAAGIGLFLHRCRRGWRHWARISPSVEISNSIFDK